MTNDENGKGNGPIFVIPRVADHEDPMRRMMSDAAGTEYVALTSLENARKVADAVVVLQGDDGGQIYVVAPVKYVSCDEPALRQLLAEVDAICWRDPSSARVYFEVKPVGSGIAGGMGGGRVIDGVWVHARLQAHEANIEAVLKGERRSLTPKPYESIDRRIVEAGAVAFVRRHFDLLNEGALDSAKTQLYVPSIGRRAADVYVQAMGALSPFRAIALSVSGFRACKDTPQGLRASIEIDVTAQCALGVRSSFFSVWWFPNRQEYLIATRPSDWVLEQVRGGKWKGGI